MDTYLQDRLAIADLMTGWIHRDLAEWDQLRALFHADGVIEITWFEGKVSDFVDGSTRMGASDIRTKYLVAAPVVTFHGDKAIAETNAMVIAENVKLRVGCSVHCRFYDEVEKRAGVWKIIKRQAVYDMGSFTFPLGISISMRRPSRSTPPSTRLWPICWTRAAFRCVGSSQRRAAHWRRL
jgi:SnoaL-like protein